MYDCIVSTAVKERIANDFCKDPSEKAHESACIYICTPDVTNVVICHLTLCRARQLWRLNFCLNETYLLYYHCKKKKKIPLTCCSLQVTNMRRDNHFIFTDSAVVFVALIIMNGFFKPSCCKLVLFGLWPAPHYALNKIC